MQIFGVEIHKLKYKEFFREITKLEKQVIVFTPNPEILLKTRTDKEFKGLLEKANYLTSDGIGLYLAYQILNNNFGRFLNTILLPYFLFNLFFRRSYLYKKYGERICGSDLTRDLIDFACISGTKIVILDLYNPTDTKKVESQKVFSDRLKVKFPKLDFDYYVFNPEKKDKIIETIKQSDAKILFSTLGMKAQEQSVVEIMERCENIKLGLGVGSSFDYFIGFQKRAPKFWRILGLEWLYRLLTGPRKLTRFKRLWNAIFIFIFTVIKNKK
ncbi:MAG: WecB/TagA/CpsF family glycosyltransferase [Candidatus Gracilibacteria bacterium]|nr:WecB/TagA/CpsF family glycosyltransferase [Candidatus Gracilibacteria bacterium]